MMKNMKRHTKPVIAIVLALVLIVSTAAVGIIATNAAYLNGKPKSAEAANAEADVADANEVNAVGAKADDVASVGAKAPEAVGANADSDEVGVNVTGTVYIRAEFAGDWSDSGVAMSQKDGNYFYSVNSLANGKEFKFKYNGTEYGKSSSENGSGQRNVTGYGTSSSSYKSIEAGSSTFFWTGSTGAATIWVNGDLTRTWVTSGTTQNTSYDISYNTPSNGSFTTKPTTGTQGSTVTVVATPSTGYQINTVSVYKTGASSTTVSTSRSGNTITFTMPAYAVTVNVTFSVKSYNITKAATGCSITAASTAAYGSTVNFTIVPDTDYALKSLTVKQGTTTILPTSTGENAYSFTMPAGDVTITATCTTTVGVVSFRFKSATAWVYHPFISVNGGPEVEMTLGSTPTYLDNSTNAYHPKSETGSLRYAWYTADMTGVDTSKPVTITVRGQDTYMEATGSFTLEAGSEVWLACDNLMEGSDLVNVTNLTPAQRDFYDTPLNMIDN